MTRLVVCVGIAALDQVFEVDTLPTTAAKYAARRRREVVGGIAANAAVAIARLGGQARLVSRVANDMAGRSLRAALAAAGVDCSSLETLAEGCTSTSAVFLDPQGERMLVNHKDPTLFAGVPIQGTINAGTGAVMCDLRWPQAARGALDAAAQLGVPGVLDYDSAPENGTELIPLASHVIFGDAALQGLAPAEKRQAALAALAQAHPGVAFAVTAGARGTFWTEGGCSGHIPALPVRVVDTLGAGDVFHGAAALALAEGRAFAEALSFASVAAALKVSRPSGPDAFPTRPEVEKLKEVRP